MKYCLFDGGDVVGPFSADELLAKRGFGAHSLVCPETHSEEEGYWKEAYLYEDFGFQTPQQKASRSTVDGEVFPTEMRHSVASTDSQEMSAPSEDTDSVTLSQAEAEEIQTPTPEDKIQISSLLLRAGQSNKEDSLATPPAEQSPAADTFSAEPSPIEEYFNSIRSGDLGNILGMPDPKANSDMSLARVLSL